MCGSKEFWLTRGGSFKKEIVVFLPYRDVIKRTCKGSTVFGNQKVVGDFNLSSFGRRGRGGEGTRLEEVKNLRLPFSGRLAGKQSCELS